MAVPTVLVVLDVATRVALPAALLALAHRRADLAVLGSFASAGSGAARGLLLGWWTERALVGKWRDLVEAARRQPTTTLTTDTQGESAALLSTVREAAVYEAQAVPRMLGLVLSLIALAALVTAMLGVVWLLLGGLAAILLGTVAALGQRRLRSTYDQVWEDFSAATRDATVLMEASAELRVHAREEAFAVALLERVDSMARKERVATAWQVAVTLIPATIAVASVAGPIRAGAAWALATFGSAGALANVGILGGMAVVTGLSLAQAAEHALRTAPERRMLDRFLAASHRAPKPPTGGSTRLPGSLTSAPIAFEELSCLYPGAPIATPAPISYVWSTGRGLAVVGANGSGKSTLASLLLGLIAPTAGRITVAGVPLHEIDLADLRRRVVYVPQRGFVAPGESVAWHLRFFADGPISNERVDTALAGVGLLEVLGQHASRTKRAPRDVLAGELSGGERQRMHLSRLLLGDAQLVVLDEPEVGLDHAGRTLLRGLIERLASRARVLVIAHDESIVPESFERLVCTRGSVA